MINYQKALTSLRYFATHCVVNAKTKKPFKWTNTQLNLLDALQKYEELNKQKKLNNYDTR